MNNLVLSNYLNMDSRKVVEIINNFRNEEGNKTELTHSDFLKSIRKEIESLESVGISTKGNFSLSSYKKGFRKYSCYLMTKAGVMQMLNKESATVRYKTQLYVERLEQELKPKENSILPKLPLTYKEALQQLLEQVEKNEEQAKTLQEQAPKVEYHDKVLKSSKLITTTAISKDLNMTARELHKILHEEKIIFKQGKIWCLYAEHREMIPKYCDYEINEYSQTLKWTEEGRKFIINVLENREKNN